MKHPSAIYNPLRAIYILAWLLLSFAPAYAQSVAQSPNLPDFTALVEQNSAAVVNISTTQKIKRSMPQLPPGAEMPNLPEGSPLNDLFKHFFGEGQGGPGIPEEFDAQSLGSGFIISPEGYVLTNNHVVKNADKIIVRLSDRRELVAKVIGTDERSDLALLKVEAQNLPVVTLGTSSKLKVGEWVFAIGSPFGFDHSATAGIVSAIGRSLPSESYVPFIQTDVAINPGNSGGPLFNLKGEVVGINSQIFSRTGGFMGLSFAIPVDVALDVTEQLKAKGRVTRGWLGILIQDVTSDLAESFGMANPEGALIAKVLPESPAAKSNLQVGDVVVKFDGKPIVESSDLPRLVGSSKIGAQISIDVIRNGKPLTIATRIEELPKEEEVKLSDAAPKAAVDNRLGIVVADMTAEQRKQFEIKTGVLVQQVNNGPALKAGIQRGDLVLSINNVEIDSTERFNTVVKSLPSDKSVPVLVQRGEGALFLALKIEKDDQKDSE
ncbi:MAG: DegQ family serine endoprotease [Gammaproteobacteria bacterium]